MSTALILFSTHSEAAQQRAKELDIEYSGHDRICGVNVNANMRDISEAVTEPKRVWENAGKAPLLQRGDVARESPR